MDQKRVNLQPQPHPICLALRPNPRLNLSSRKPALACLEVPLLHPNLPQACLVELQLHPNRNKPALCLERLRLPQLRNLNKLQPQEEVFSALQTRPLRLLSHSSRREREWACSVLEVTQQRNNRRPDPACLVEIQLNLKLSLNPSLKLLKVVVYFLASRSPLSRHLPWADPFSVSPPSKTSKTNRSPASCEFCHAPIHFYEYAHLLTILALTSQLNPRHSLQWA